MLVQLLTLLVAWLLIVPPALHCDGAPRMDDRQPLWMWERRGEFADVAACRRHRDDRIVGARDDVEWAYWSLARCFTAERASGGALTWSEMD